MFHVDAVTVVLFRLFSVLANRQFISNNLDRLDMILEPTCHEREVYNLTHDDVAIDVSDVRMLVSLFVCLSVRCVFIVHLLCVYICPYLSLLLI